MISHLLYQWNFLTSFLILTGQRWAHDLLGLSLELYRTASKRNPSSRYFFFSSSSSWVQGILDGLVNAIRLGNLIHQAHIQLFNNDNHE